MTAKEMKFFGNVDGSATSGAVAVLFSCCGGARAAICALRRSAAAPTVRGPASAMLPVNFT
ncbi:MAG TPA: hypothetical protein VGB36_08290 [Gammaproteobacteria bacterium]